MTDCTHSLSRHARGGKQKRGTTNKKQAKARDKRIAKKATAAARTAAEAMADLAEPDGLWRAHDHTPHRTSF